MFRVYLALAAASGLLAVALGAFGAHALRESLDAYGLSELEPETFDADLDDETLLCVVEDSNGACWLVFLDEADEVGYDFALPDLDD